MKFFAWVRFVIWEAGLTAGAAIGIALLPHFAGRRAVTYGVVFGGLWLAFTLLNVHDLIERLRIENVERDAHRALARSLGDRS
jgi:hypothetical protein